VVQNKKYVRNTQEGEMATLTKRKHAPQFKFDVAIKAIESNQMAEISRQYGVTTGLVSKWVAQVKKNGATLFTTTPDKEISELKSKMARLEQLVGKKEIELSLMKNFVDFYESGNGK
jgi:transposase